MIQLVGSFIVRDFGLVVKLLIADPGNASLNPRLPIHIYWNEICSGSS